MVDCRYDALQSWHLLPCWLLLFLRALLQDIILPPSLRVVTDSVVVNSITIWKVMSSTGMPTESLQHVQKVRDRTVEQSHGKYWKKCWAELSTMTTKQDCWQLPRHTRSTGYIYPRSQLLIVVLTVCWHTRQLTYRLHNISRTTASPWHLLRRGAFCDPLQSVFYLCRACARSLVIAALQQQEHRAWNSLP